MSVPNNYRMVMMRAEALANARWSTIASCVGSRRIRPDHAGAPASGRDPHAPGSRPVPGKELFATTYVELDLSAANALELADELVDRAGWMLEEQVRQQLRQRARSDVPPALDMVAGDRIEPVYLMNAKGPIRVRDTVEHGTARVRLDFELLLRVLPEQSIQEKIAATLVPTVAPVVMAAVDACSDNNTTRVLAAFGDVSTMKHGQQKVTVLVGVGEQYAGYVEQVAKQFIEQARNDTGADGSTGGAA
jgi:hypothetical protein